MAHPKHPITPQFNRRQALMALLGSVALPGCGGGGSVAGLSSGGTGSFTSGVIIGLGSIIVNGTRYDDSAATVNGSRASGIQDQLKLGMVVSVQGSKVTQAAGGLATATATSISYESEWKGQIESVNVLAKTFVMLGQTVRWLTTTVFSPDPIEQKSLPIYAEVYGFVNPVDGVLQASRVEFSSGRPDEYRLSGVMSNLNSVNHTFELGGAVINYGSATNLPALQNDMIVRVDIDPNSIGPQWMATRIRGLNPLADIEYSDDDEAEIEGSITAFANNGDFSVNGIPVSALNANFEVNDTELGLGVRVKVEGTVVNGTIVASKVELEDDNTVEAREFEFHGALSDLTATSFKVRGETVAYTVNGTSSTRFDLKGETWGNGLSVEVKAVIAPDGQLTATQIKLDN